MNLVTPRSNLDNSKLFFSKSELTKILKCYSIGVSKGNWKDYAIDFTKNDAIFLIYKHSWTSPDCVLSKLKEREREKITYKLSISNKKYKNFSNLDELISSLKKKQIKLIT